MSAVLTVCSYRVTRSWCLISTDQHNSNELLLAREDVALFLHTLADGFGYEANTLDQTQLHSQVLYWAKQRNVGAQNKERQMTHKDI